MAPAALTHFHDLLFAPILVGHRRRPQAQALWPLEVLDGLSLGGAWAQAGMSTHSAGGDCTTREQAHTEWCIGGHRHRHSHAQAR